MKVLENNSKAENTIPWVSVVILAAGRGTRMKAKYRKLPKPLIPIAGTPMIRRIVEAVRECGVARRITIVTSPGKKGLFKKVLGGQPIQYVVQLSPKGTAHAVAAARSGLHGNAIMVLVGDQPLITAATLRRVLRGHAKSQPAMTMLTATLRDFRGARAAFKHWGRIVRKPSGELVRIVESKDASRKELATREVNPSVYCFDRRFLARGLKRLSASNKQGEYLLTDMLAVAKTDALRVRTVRLKNPMEVLGANTPDEVKIIESVVRRAQRGEKPSLFSAA